jgi:hypothetical protein
MSRWQLDGHSEGGAGAARGDAIVGVETSRVLLIAAALAGTLSVESTAAIDLLGFKITCSSTVVVGSIVEFVRGASQTSGQL